MITRKVQYRNKCFLTIIPKTLASILGLKLGDSINFELVEDKKIMIAPVQTKPEISRNVKVNDDGKATSGNRSPIMEARDHVKITTGDNSPINQENIFIQLFWSKGTIIGAIIVIVLKIIYYFWRKTK
ncbi:MAG: hypothetical protein KKA10_01800 [Euryarchaeota archaeon]|nr:hypothetical protein [Euryarchaeota archaeon]MCG2737791.1 hypothetical protein [Candidatus Methanoperedenaceae archaeon]